MALDNVPWFIGGGAEHSPAVARTLAYAATNGADGIITPTDLKVTALPTPGAAVRVAPGAAVMLNRYPGGTSQSYIGRNESSTDVSVTATGSSGGVTRYLIMRVDDPQFGGPAPANVLDGPYVRFVWVSSITNLAYPFAPLAKLVQPANTATITNAMLTNIREVANPRSPELQTRVSAIATAHNLTANTFQNFPNVAESIRVPDWATYAVCTAFLSGMQQVDGAVSAEFYLQAKSIQGQLTAIDQPGVGSGYGRVPTVMMKWENPVGDIAGQNIELRIRARKLAGTGYVRADNYTQIMFQVQFTQGPV